MGYDRWSSYSNNYGWYCNNEPSFFGGIHPSTWGDGAAYAWNLSSDKNVLRMMFPQKMWGAFLQGGVQVFFSPVPCTILSCDFKLSSEAPCVCVCVCVWPVYGARRL